jgi:protease-4
MSVESDLLADRRRLKRRIGWWRGLAILAIAALVAFLVTFDAAEGRFVLRRGDYIAWLDVVGVITEDRRLETAIRDIAKDDNAKAVIVYISSPGGSTYGAEQLFVELRKAAERKPVVAVIGTMGASGGYLAALAADRTFARESSIVGSIGVLFQTVEVSRLMDKLGVTAEAVTSGPLKAEPSPFKPLSERGRASVQHLVNQAYEWFVGLVADRRGLAVTRARELADGRVFHGREALDAGLIDQIGGEQEARDWLAREKGIDRNLPRRLYPAEPVISGLAEQGARIIGKSVFPERLTLDGLVSLWHPELPR